MSRLASAILFVLSILLAKTSLSQTNPALPDSRSEADRSPYQNQPVLHPEALSGVWETQDGEGGAVGIHLELSTSISSDEHTPWTSQAWDHLEVAVFHRSEHAEELGENNDFSDSMRGGGVSVKDNRLTLHYLWSQRKPLAIDLDLTLKPDGCWHGRFHRNAFDRTVSLCRPTAGKDVPPDSLAGTWFASSSMRCVHIFQNGPDAFTGWADSLEFPGRITFSPRIPEPHPLFEHYGSLVKIDRPGPGIVRIKFGAYNPICCPIDFLGKFSADHSRMEGNTGNTFPMTFTRVQGDACIP
jgi:hypothetical protein